MHHWPALGALLSSYFGERFWFEYSSVDAARTAAVEHLDHRARKKVLSEWWDWNSSAGAVDDIRLPVAQVGVELPFDTGAEARKFMNAMYDVLIAKVRLQEPGWKP